LDNKVIAANIAAYPPAVSILKAVGFVSDDGSPQNSLILAKGKKVINVGRITTARDSIDKWIDKNIREIAAAKRKKEDEIARAKLLEEAEEIEEGEDSDQEEENTIDPNICQLKLRLEGKKKIHDVTLEADDPFSTILTALPVTIPEGEEIQITCTARRLIVKSTDSVEMNKTFREHKLVPAATVVIKIGNTNASSSSASDKPNLKERAAARKAKKKGEHTMQSIGIYAKDDNAKGELIDGGGGVWFEHDVTSDDEENTNELEEEENAEEEAEKEDQTEGNANSKAMEEEE